MLLPPEYAWIGLVILGAIFVFIADLIGNTLNFESRFVNAFTTTIVFAVAFAFFIRFRYGSVMLTDWGLAVMNPAP
jgi:ABC-type Fe3+-siderophore transport system permease subunit